MFAVIRRYTNASKLIEAMEQKPQEVERVIAGTPGFVAYHAIRTADTVVTISVCQDDQSAAETTRRAAEWVRENLPAGAVAAPEVTSGEAFINLHTGQTVGA
jgi:hypothetical protein